MTRVSVRMLYFAAARDMTGRRGETLELDAGAAESDDDGGGGGGVTLCHLVQTLRCKYPTLTDLLAKSALSLNLDVIEMENGTPVGDAAQIKLKNGDEVAVIPPVSGG